MSAFRLQATAVVSVLVADAMQDGVEALKEIRAALGELMDQKMQGAQGRDGYVSRADMKSAFIGEWRESWTALQVARESVGVVEGEGLSNAMELYHALLKDSVFADRMEALMVRCGGVEDAGEGSGEEEQGCDLDDSFMDGDWQSVFSAEAVSTDFSFAALIERVMRYACLPEVPLDAWMRRLVARLGLCGGFFGLDGRRWRCDGWRQERRGAGKRLFRLLRLLVLRMSRWRIKKGRKKGSNMN
jgi:hypothetical protein